MSHKSKISNMLVALMVMLIMLACNLPFPWIDSVVPGGNWYVNKAGDDSNDCLSESSACLTITAAVSKALTAGVIQIGPGVFEETSSFAPEAIGLFVENKVLTFRGKVTDGTLETIISGGHARTAVEVRPSAILIFQDLIIQDGGGRLEAGAGYGLKINRPAVSALAGVELSNVIIRNNEQGGVLILDRGPVTLDNVQVLANGYGLTSSTTGLVTIENSTFSGNTNGAITNDDGGKMVIIATTINGTELAPYVIFNQGDMKIEGSTISGSGDYGGDGILSEGPLTMIDSTVTLNNGVGIVAEGELSLNGVEVSHNNGDGVKTFDTGNVTLYDIALIENGGFGLYNTFGHVTIYNSHIVGNKGGGFHNGGRAEIISTEIAGNYLLGVINMEDGIMVIDSSTISGTLPDGTSPNIYGIYNRGDSMTVTNSTISGNTEVGIFTRENMSLVFSTVAENGSTGILIDPGLVFNLENSIVENNAGENCYRSHVPPIAIIELTGANLSDESCWSNDGDGMGIIQSNDASLDHLADNGGSAQTNALLPGSLAIDAATESCPATDQRGIARPQGPGCDIGAYEFSGSAIAPLVIATPSGGVPGVIPLYTDTPELSTPAILTFTTNANCRQGPNTAYEVVTSFYANDQVTIEGRSEDSFWYWVLIPNSNSHCFVSGTTGSPQGPMDGLVIVPAPALPPTKTPTLLVVTAVPPAPIVTVTAPAPVPPAAPGNFNVSTKSCTSSAYVVALRWGNVTGELGYRIYRDGVLIATLPVDSTTYDDTSPDYNSHSYQIQAYNDGGTANSSAQSSEGCMY